MPAMSPLTQPGNDWHLLSLRPAGAHASLRAAAARQGGRVLALSPWRIVMIDDVNARAQLRRALASPVTLFTSPAAVVAAQRLLPDFTARLRCAIAVGDGSARALRRCGVRDVIVPSRMDSEGVLALPHLARLRAAPGLVTAPGGRGQIVAALAARQIAVHRADVYRRQPISVSARTLARLATLHTHSVLALSSAEALQQLLPQLPAPTLAALRQRPVVAASDRLAAVARARGFAWVQRAQGPMPAQLALAAAQVVTSPPPD